MWIEILCFFFNFVNCFVTLFTRVWIEIINSKGKLNNAFCHSLYESVNWNVFIFIIINFIYSHSLYESVNWNIGDGSYFEYKESHSLYESVNWNLYQFFKIKITFCHSLYESVNWNNKVCNLFWHILKSLSLRECELK